MEGTGRLLFMIKRVLFSGGLLLGAAYLGCGGDTGTNPGGGTGTIQQKPAIITDRDAVVDTLCKNALRRETLTVTNKGVEDLVINSVALAPTSAPGFTLLANGVLSSDPDGGTPQIITTLKSNQIGFVAMQFQPPTTGQLTASLNISTNATNVTNGLKTVALGILAPDAGTQGCP